jgi:TetR/AcrR family transcriptional regulator
MAIAAARSTRSPSGPACPSPICFIISRRKDDIYRAVLEKTLADWLAPLCGLDPEGEPLAEISRYVSAKMAMSRDNPKASRLFANEMLHGAPIIGDFLSGPMKALVDATAQIIRAWITKGQIAAIDPYHLIFTIWAMTQHYADFDIQIRAVLGENSDHFPNAETTIIRLIQDGLAAQMTVTLRPWTEADLPVLEACNTPEEKKYLGGPESPERLAKRNRDYAHHAVPGETRMFCIGHDGRPAGSIGLLGKGLAGRHRL